MKNPKYYNGNGIPYSWSNLNFIDRNINVVTVMDIIEDAKNGEELVKNLRKLNMVHNTWTVDKETEAMVRIKNTDRLGNVTYIECEKEKATRLVTLAEGTGMGDCLIVFETDAPVAELKELERISCDAYINGDGMEDVPIWSIVLGEKGYLFACVDDHQHVTAHGTSEDWLEKNYPSITERYVIENQPEIGDNIR